MIDELKIVNQGALDDVLSNSVIDRDGSLKVVTGYPTIDRPWDKYYRSEPVREVNPNQTMYEAITGLNSENMDLDTIGYLGKSIDYNELIFKADKLAENLKEIEVKEDDVVLLSLPSVPEASMFLLALNKIGAISKWIDLRVKADDLREYINEHQSKHVIIFDMLLESMKNIIDDTSVQKVIVVNPVESLGIIPKALYGFKGIISGNDNIYRKDKRFIRYSDFININSTSKVNPNTFDKDRPSLIIQSSGTTGKAKSIVHTDYGINSSVRKFSYMDVPLYVGERVLVVVPTWIGYGLINSYYQSLALGMKAELCPKVDRTTVFENLGKFDISFAAPLHYKYVAENIDKCKDLSDIKALVTGGDKITPSEIEEMMEAFVKKGFDGQIVNGYGNNEGLGAETINPLKHNKYGTVGIPLYGDLICAVNSDNEELKYNEAGEICVRTESHFTEYSNMPEETREVKQIHSDGGSWIHTGDLGTIDEEGFVHLKGRLKRVIIRTAFKIFPGTIEEVIKTHPMVKDCVTVGVDDDKDTSVPMAFISLKEECLNCEEVLNEIGLICEKRLKDYEIPAYFELIDEIPYTGNNKQDYRKLELIGNEKVKKNSKQKVLK